MITVLAWILTVNLNVGSYTVQPLPTLAECQRLGPLQTIGRTAATWDCKSYSALVVSQTGTPPTNTNYLTAN